MITDDYRWLQMITDDYRWLQMITDDYRWPYLGIFRDYRWLQFFPSPRSDLDPIRSVPDPQSHDGWHVVFHIGMLPAAHAISRQIDPFFVPLPRWPGELCLYDWCEIMYISNLTTIIMWIVSATFPTEWLIKHQPALRTTSELHWKTRDARPGLTTQSYLTSNTSWAVLIC